MMKELRCALALALVGLVSATPYGYGVKGGAAGTGGAAKAAANAGAISSVSGLPLSIPSGAGFSGSFSNSASSSFSSSSASSSSGSYTFSGAGAPGLAGFGNGATATGGCATGGCQTGAKDISGLGANGLQGYNAAGAVAGAAAGGITEAGYTIKDDSAPCVTGDCSQKYGSASGNYNAQLPKEATEKSESDALTEISSTGDIDITKCKSGKCGYIPQGSPSSNYDSNNCALGQCGPNSQAGTLTGSASAAGTSAGAYGSNKMCATGQCETSSSPDALTKPYESGSKCMSGQCGLKLETGIPSANYGSDNTCASGQCGISSQPASPPHNNGPDSNCALGNCGGTPPVYHGPDSKPTSYHVGSTVHPEIPSTSYGHPVATSQITGINNKCISGNCSPNTLTGPAVPNYGPYDIPITGSKATYNSNKDTSNFDKTSDVSVEIKSDCSLGNCGPSTVSNYKVPLSNPHPASGKPNDGPLNYGYNPTPLGGSTTGLNKPATYLTTPKLQANYVQITGPSNYNTPGSYSPSLHADKPCLKGNCDLGKPSNPFANSGSYTSNYGSSKYPNTILPSGASDSPCSTPNCAPNLHPHDFPKTPGYGSAPGYQVPAGLGSSNVPASCTSGNCATYPSPSNTGYGIVSPAAISPSYGQTTSHASTGSAAVAGFPSLLPVNGPSSIESKYPSFAPSYTPISTTSGCNTPNCSPYLSPNPGAIHSTPSVVSVAKPGVDESSDKNLPPYTGGFGGPAGLLKPYENITPGVPSNTYNKPTVPTSVYNPTGANSYHQPTIPTGTYSSSAPNSFNKPATPPTGSSVPACSSGNCGTPSGQPAHPHVQIVPTPTSGSQVVHGPSIPQAVSGAVAGAHAETEGIIYTGGFGGPPGLLKPYDGGKIDSTGPIKYPSNSLTNLPHSTSGSATPGSYGTSYTKLGTAYPAAGSNVGVGTGSSAQAGAVAGTSSSTIGGTNDHGYGGHIGGTNIHEHKGSSGCGGGCGSSTGGSYSGAFGLSTGQSLSKAGHVDGLSGGLSASGATAKSLAGAVSGANTFGTSGSFASSAASAHASAGAGVKGGYYG